MTDDMIVKQTAAMLQSDNCAVFMATKDSMVIGVAGMNASPSYGELHAQEVFWKVKEGHTKSKAGARLLVALEEAATEMDASAFTVVALAGPHEKRVGNSYVSRGYAPVCSTYMKRLG
jgi:N-acetylglutamate synthase-like GNAT family acetyltransferase